MRKILRDYGFLAAVAGSIIVLDQITKAIVRANIPYGEMWMPWEWLAPYARIVHWYNTGAAFGMFQGMGDVFKILSALVSVAIIYYFPRVERRDWALRLAMSMQLGGAVGNLIDRFTVGHVTDFVSVGTFPVFNVADASISVGVVVLLLGAYIQERREKQASAATQTHLNDIPGPGEVEPPLEQENLS